jgi:hypothetical protein
MIPDGGGGAQFGHPKGFAHADGGMIVANAGDLERAG